MYGTIPIAVSFSKKGMRDDWLAAFMMASILLTYRCSKSAYAECGGRDRMSRAARSRGGASRDAALDRLRDEIRNKNHELYEVKTALYDAEQKIVGLMACINQDHTNSSKPSSQSSNHKTISNGRERTGRKLGGQRVHAVFPEGLKDEVIYDGTLKAFTYLLNNECYVEIGKTQNFIKEVTGGSLELSAGLICSLSKQFSEQTKEERDEIFLKLFYALVMHADFAFGRMNGSQAAVMICAAGDTVLYQGRPKKRG